MKIAFSCALAFVLSLFCFPQLSFAPHTSPSTISAAGWPNVYRIPKFYSDAKGYYCYAGMYPQTYVGPTLNSQLEERYQSGDVSVVSGVIVNRYYWDILRYDDGNLYARGEQHGCTYTGAGSVPIDEYHGGGYIDDGEIGWFRVEPIKWWVVDGSNPITNLGQTVQLVSDAVLLGGIPWTEENTTSPPDYLDSYLYSTLNSGMIGNCMFGELEFYSNEEGYSNDNMYWFDDQDGGGTLNPISVSMYDTLYDKGLNINFLSDFAVANGALNSQVKFCFTRDKTSNGKIQLVYSYTSDSTLTTYDGGNLLNSFPNDSIGVRLSITLRCYDNSSSALQFDSGISGYPGIKKTSTGVYHITNFSGLQAMSDYTNACANQTLSGTFYLDNDIDCKKMYLAPILHFGGTIDGQGHSLINFNSNHLIENITNGSVTNLSILNWKRSSYEITSLIGAANISSQTQIKNVYIDLDWTNVGAGSAGIICRVTTSNNSPFAISNVGICGRFTTNSGYPLAFVGTGIGRIENSFFNGSRVTSGSTFNPSGGGYVYYGGVYVCYGTVKKYWSGFAASDWICSSTVNGGFPALKQYLHVTGPTTSSVETYLKGKGFTAVS